MPGLNLLDAAAVAARDTLYGAIFEHNAIDIHNPAANVQYRWIIEKNWKLIVPHAANVPGAAAELYDLSNDPNETENRAAQHPATVTALTRKLDAWWKP
jgi:uncharacterized sulfatase